MNVRRLAVGHTQALVRKKGAHCCCNHVPKKVSKKFAGFYQSPEGGGRNREVGREVLWARRNPARGLSLSNSPETSLAGVCAHLLAVDAQDVDDGLRRRSGALKCRQSPSFLA